MNTFYMPVRVIMGNSCIEKNSIILNSFGRKALVVTGKNSAKKSGALYDIELALKKENIDHIVFDEVDENPTSSSVLIGAKLGIDNGVDFIIGCGGGSPLDAAKAISLAIANKLSRNNFFSGEYNTPALPIVAVPTTAGTGSEVTQYAIITDDTVNRKKNVSSASTFPQVAFLDAKYTMSLPYNITVDTSVDALTHALEGYFSKKSTFVSNIFAMESMQIIGRVLRQLGENPSIHLREELLYASMLAGVVIAHTGTTALHAMGYPLIYYKGMSHGRSNGLLLCSYLEYIKDADFNLYNAAMDKMGFSSLNEFKLLITNLFNEKLTLSEVEIIKYSNIAIEAKEVQFTPGSPSLDDLVIIYKKGTV